MTRVSTECLESLVGALVVGTLEETAFADADVNNAEDARRVIAALVVPYYRMATKASQDLCKEGLRYYLLRGRPEHFSNVFEDLQECVIANPDDPKRFFQLIWEVLFPNERPESRSIEGYFETDDRTLGLRFKPGAP